MIITYRPDGAPVQDFEFFPADLETPESELLESVGGDSWKTFEEFGVLFFRGSQRAYRAALWVMLRRTNPVLKFKDVSFRASQVTVGYSDSEREAILQVLLADPNIDAEERSSLTQIIGEESVAEAEEALTKSGVEREPDLKDLSEFSGNVSSTLPREVSRQDSESSTAGL